MPGATERDHGYWRDVGTLDAFYDAHMDLVSVHPVFNLYNKRWPIRGESENLAPAKFVNGGSAQESVVGAGSIISAASVRNSVLSSNVVVDDGAIVEGSVLMPGVRVGRGAVVRHAILDKNVVVGPGEMVGVDLEKDRRTVRDQRRRRGRRRQGRLDLTSATREIAFLVVIWSGSQPLVLARGRDPSPPSSPAPGRSAVPHTHYERRSVQDGQIETAAAGPGRPRCRSR